MSQHSRCQESVSIPRISIGDGKQDIRRRIGRCETEGLDVLEVRASTDGSNPAPGESIAKGCSDPMRRGFRPTFAFARRCVIRQLNDFLESPPSGLQFHDQRTNWMHYFLRFFCGQRVLIGNAFGLP